MASNIGAYYEGLQYANQGVEPVNFGDFAMGYAKIKEDQRLEKKQDQARKEATQMEMTKLFGEEIYSAFDGTGLADVDIVNSKIKDSIIARANVLNSLFEKGELTAPQLMQEMNKMSSQSKKYAAFANSISAKMDEIQKLGGDASEYTTFMLQNLDNLMNNATPVMDSSGNLSFLSKDGDEIVNNPFNQLERMLDVRKKYDVNSVIDSVVRSKAKQKVVRNGKVIERYNDIGDSDEVAFRNIVNTLDDADRFDIAQRAGIPIKRAKGSYLKITNKEEVDNAIVDYMKTQAQGKLDQYVAVDEVEAAKLGIQQSQEARAKKAAEVAVVNVVKDDQGNAIETQASPAPGKTASVRSLIVGNETIPVANIGKLVVDEKTGAHRATISYEIPIEAPIPSGAELVPALQKVAKQGGNQTKVVTQEVTLTDPAVINQVRAQLDMPLLKQQSNPYNGAGRFNKP